MAQIKSTRIIVAAIMAIFVYGMIAAMLGTLMPTFKLTQSRTAVLHSLAVPLCYR